MLHPALAVEVMDAGARLVELSPAARDSGTAASEVLVPRRYRVEPAPGQQRVTLRYDGPIMHALQQQGRVNFRDIERTVVNEIERLTGAMVQAIQEGRRREYSVERYREALDSEIEIFRAGEGSSIDVILTQEELLNEQVQLVSARRTIAFLATQLSFEMGRIVDCSIDGEAVTVMAFHPVGDIASFASSPPFGGKGSTDGSE